MKIKPITTYLSILNHLLYLSSSPAAVSIRNHAYNNMISAINASIHNIQLTAFCMISDIKALLAAVSSTSAAHGTHIVFT
jgi:hypothetical protein